MEQTKKHGEIIIYSVSPFDIQYKNVIKFNNYDEMDTFFVNSDVLHGHCNYLKCIYIKSDYVQVDRTGELIVEGRVEKYEKATYMRFWNKDRIYYAFILNCFYENENATRIQYEIDTFNTYQVELWENDIDGYVEKRHLRRFYNNGQNFNIYNSIQGINKGLEQVAYSEELELIDWIVFVMKPSTKINDDTLENGSINGIFSPYTTLVLPVKKDKTLTYPFEIDGITFKTAHLNNFYKKLVNSFDDKNNTVNNVVNIYYTKHCGLDYELIKENDIIKKVKIKDGGNILFLDTITNSQNNSPHNTTKNTISLNNDNFSDISDGGYTLSAEDLKSITEQAKANNVLPSFIVAQLRVESLWGNSEVARLNNNWGGIVYASDVRPSGVRVSRGTPKPANEIAGHYAKYESVNDYFKDYFYLLVNQGIYNVVGKNFDESVKGLFTVGGAKYNYAESGYNHYQPLMVQVRQRINANNNGILDKIDNL